MILIGSRALLLRAPKLLRRQPNDFDFVCTKEEFDQWLDSNKNKIDIKKIYPEKNKMIIEGNPNCEFEISEPKSSTQMLIDLVTNEKESYLTPFGLIPSLDMLFTIKASHKYLKNSPAVFKTMQDYHVLKNAGAKIRPEYKEFLSLREKETYNYSHPKLNVSKQDFFKDDNIEYVYDHDDIHKSVALYDKPAYTFYLKDGEQVQCDKSKFFSIDEKYRLAGVVEEAAVLSIERSLIPHPGVWSPEFAWKFAFSKVCTSITSGWFREFAYENAPTILKMYPKGYWEKFQSDIKQGLVRSFNK
jgi:hypothetical protein